MRNFRPFLVLAASLLVPTWAKAAAPAERRAVVFYTAETHGTLEPCGCTSDPLGDFARVTALVRAAAGRNQAAVLVDAGSLMRPAALESEKNLRAAGLRTEFLAREIEKLPFGGSAIGDSDLAHGPGAIRPKRLAVNLAQAPFVDPSRIVTVGSIKIGILGVVDPDLARRESWMAQEPSTAARQEIVWLRSNGSSHAT